MKQSDKSAEETLVITRVFDAPRELVWKVWTEPEHIRQWWGPKEFTAPFVTVDLRPGGRLHFSMRSPDGQENWVAGEFIEIVPPERLVWLMYFSDAEGNRRKPTDYGVGPDYPEEFRDEITFEALDNGRTRLTARRNTPVSVSKLYGEEQGWNESLDKLAAELVRAAKG